MSGMGDKVAHVRAAMGTGAGGHHCHWPNCPNAVPPAMWGCKPHWFLLPPGLRAKIWRTYRPGQEATKTPSKEYLQAALEVQKWIKGYLAAGCADPVKPRQPKPQQGRLL